MKFKILDRVRVVNVEESAHKDCIGATGVIIDVDYSWAYPYEIEFDDGKKFTKDLFHDGEIVLFAEKSENTQDYINIKFKNGQSDGASVADVIDVLLAKIKLQHNNGNNLGINYHLNITNTIARLTEAKMWADELEKTNK